ncbi:MAG: hypothetical protein AB1Z23_05275 [Eubacteriales bacterium]
MSSVFTDVQNLIEKYIELWQKTTPDISFLKEYSYKDKKIKEKEIFKAIDELSEQISSLPDDINNKEWQHQLKLKISQQARAFLKIQNKEFENLMIEGFLESTNDFISKAQKFDESLKFEDIYQAMRNVWIMNIIQVIGAKNIACTPSVFSYSMLYPYTDNFLDDPNISIDEKKLFNKNLKKRLEGDNIEPASDGEKQIYQLISMIESEYGREKYPRVFESILCIHAGQCKSIEQQDMAQNAKINEILNISIEKGGSSVLADAYLACGDPEENLADLMFGFGFVLQLVDDLQDAKADYQNNHITIFSGNVNNTKLDSLTKQLISFTANTLDFSSSQSKYTESIKSLIFDNTLLLIFEAIWQNNNLYSKQFIRYIKKHMPYDYRKLHKKMRKLKKKFSSLENKYKLLFEKGI